MFASKEESSRKMMLRLDIIVFIFQQHIRSSISLTKHLSLVYTRFPQIGVFKHRWLLMLTNLRTIFQRTSYENGPLNVDVLFTTAISSFLRQRLALDVAGRDQLTQGFIVYSQSDRSRSVVETPRNPVL